MTWTLLRANTHSHIRGSMHVVYVITNNLPPLCGERGVLLISVFPPFVFQGERRKDDPNFTWPGCILSRMAWFIYEWVYCTRTHKDPDLSTYRHWAWVKKKSLIYSSKDLFITWISTHFSKKRFFCTYTLIPEWKLITANTHITQVSGAWVGALACLSGQRKGGGVGRPKPLCLCVCLCVHKWEWPAYLYTPNTNSIPPPPPSFSHHSTLQPYNWAALRGAWLLSETWIYNCLPCCSLCFSAAVFLDAKTLAVSTHPGVRRKGSLLVIVLHK